MLLSQKLPAVCKPSLPPGWQQMGAALPFGTTLGRYRRVTPRCSPVSDGLLAFFHMIFAALGVGMPALLATADSCRLRTRDREYESLARTWARATAVLFARSAP